MAEFELSYFSVSTTGALAIVSQSPGKVNARTKRIEVTSTVKANLTGAEKYYVGIVQVCYRNQQINHYGPTVQQKWEFNQGIVSDSAAADERPWYGGFREPNTEGFRRRMIHGSRTMQQLQFSMTDDFAPGIAKFESLPMNAPGPNSLTQITRDQRFRLWLVAVPTSSDPRNPNCATQFIRMAEVDWRYQYDIALTIGADPGHSITAHNYNTDLLTSTIAFNAHGRGTMDSPGDSGGSAIPAAAFTAPIANDNQQLARYLNNVQTNVIVARKA